MCQHQHAWTSYCAPARAHTHSQPSVEQLIQPSSPRPANTINLCSTVQVAIFMLPSIPLPIELQQLARRIPSVNRGCLMPSAVLEVRLKPAPSECLPRMQPFHPCPCRAWSACRQVDACRAYGGCLELVFSRSPRSPRSPRSLRSYALASTSLTSSASHTAVPSFPMLRTQPAEAAAGASTHTAAGHRLTRSHAVVPAHSLL